MPETQLLHIVAPAKGEYVPAAQLVQLAIVDAPVTGENVPKAQLAHIFASGTFEYVPAGQLTQPE